MFEASNPSPHCSLESDLLTWRTAGFTQSQSFFLEFSTREEVINEPAIAFNIRWHCMWALVWRATDAENTMLDNVLDNTCKYGVPQMHTQSCTSCLVNCFINQLGGVTLQKSRFACFNRHFKSVNNQLI